AGQPGAAETITRIAGDLGPDGALVLFPEGGNVTPGRRAQRIATLRARDKGALADRAEAMPHVMVPHAGGFLSALDTASDDAAVAVEWGEFVADRFGPDYLLVSLHRRPDDVRTAELEPHGSWAGRPLLDGWSATHVNRHG
ncbi:MAG: hypothetical protein ACRDQB_00050, partial [Thermocrispum sp.]